jgi:hypothetical protein
MMKIYATISILIFIMHHINISVFLLCIWTWTEVRKCWMVLDCWSDVHHIHLAVTQGNTTTNMTTMTTIA